MGGSEQYKRLLVVDDEASVRHLLTSALRQHALTVHEAADGREAIALLRENQYAVIILDLLMPGVDGFAVIEALKDGGHQASAPVVLVLTGADRSTMNRLDAELIHGIVRKPFDPIEIATLVIACADIKSRNAFDAMTIAATMMSGAPLLAWLQHGKL